MSLEIGKEYKTKSGSTIKITQRAQHGFNGVTQDNKSVRYTPDGKVVGWSFGHSLDLIVDKPKKEEKDEK